jgi:hypothetical protein
MNATNKDAATTGNVQSQAGGPHYLIDAYTGAVNAKRYEQ